MLFTKTFFGVFAAGSALAFRGDNRVSKRDLATIQGEITKVQSGLGDLTTAIGGLNAADPNSAAAILTASNNVDGIIKAATTAITATDELSLTDALALQDSSTQLTSSVTGVIDALVAKKPDLDKLGVASVAVQTLQTQKTSSEALGQAIVSKVPAIGQGIAMMSIQKITQVLDDGITKLQAPAAGGDAGGAVSTPAASAAPPAATTPAASVEAPTQAGSDTMTTTVSISSPTMTIVPVEAANGTCMCSVMQ